MAWNGDQFEEWGHELVELFEEEDTGPGDWLIDADLLAFEEVAATTPRQ